MSEHQTIQSCTGFLLDMDGTLYVDDTILDGARELVAFLDERNLPYLFVTNNSSHSASFYQARLARLGIETREDRILTSGDATIQHLLNATTHRSVYVVGTPDLEEDFRRAGFRVNGPDSSCVVAGFDTTLTYEKLDRACALLFEGKAFFATHPDRTCITQRGLIPDVAAIIGACTAVTGRTPTIIGKPFPPMVQAGLSRLGTAPVTTAIIGDQLDTDMMMAQQNGLVAVLVMSGETTAEILESCPEDQRPALCASTVAEVLSWLR